MKWKMILKRDWASDSLKRRKGSYLPRDRKKKSPVDLSNWFDPSRPPSKPSESRHMPKKIKSPAPKPKPVPKPKRQIPPRTLIDNYFEMYRNQGKEQPTLEDIKRDEGRPLTIDEESSYYKKIKGEQ
tara:strand:- start:58 stop:438 length:381 start_codon:yes stop_codon:yes gene_type:complete